MNNNQNINNNMGNNQNNTPERVDPRNIHAEIIGELRKEKIGKPILVVEMFLLFGIVLIGLPFLYSMLNDENSTLYKIVHKGESSVEVANTTTTTLVHGEYQDGKQATLLSPSTKISAYNIQLENFNLGSNDLTFNISVYTGTMDLDAENYYLEIYSRDGQKITAIKLTGSYDATKKQVTMRAGDLSFNSTLSYQGKIVEMEEEDYPDVEIANEDPVTNIGTLTCTLDGRTIEYTFQNKYLIEIKDTVNLSKTTNQDTYINELSNYTKEASLLGNDIASVSENDNGFTYTADILLTKENYVIPSTLKDYNYYSLETPAKIIRYAQNGKGYVCK